MCLLLIYYGIKACFLFYLTVLPKYRHRTPYSACMDYNCYTLYFVNFLFWCTCSFCHFILCHLFLIKYNHFSPGCFLLFLKVASKFFKCSKTTKHLLIQWDSIFGMPLKQCMFYATNQNMHTSVFVFPKLFLITDRNSPVLH